eukprot:scaffold265_cov131-Cylindrotheca_fusiformis.AAC.8
MYTSESNWNYSPCRRRPSYSKQSKEELDAMLAQSIAELNFHERQFEQNHLHGVGEAIVEVDDEVNGLLRELSDHLMRIKGGTAYETAEGLNPAFVEDRAFRLMFLRANRYDAKASAGQMIRFFDMKLSLFGKEKLVTDITMGDLDEDDRAYLRSGTTMVLPFPDMSQRQIVMEFPALRPIGATANELRAKYYTYMEALKSENAQLKGLVIVAYFVGEFRERFNGAGFRINTKFAFALPIHVAGGHGCYDDQGQYSLVGSAIMTLLPAKIKTRCRVHFGSHQECLYHLSTFGIPSEIIPIDKTNYTVKIDYHKYWYQERLSRDTACGQSPVPTPMDVKPCENDVLYVAGKTCINDGNLRLRLLAKRYVEVYTKVREPDKKAVVQDVIDEIRSLGGRFLSQDGSSNGPWQEMPMELVRLKIAQTFRNLRRTQNAAQAIEPSAFRIESGVHPCPKDVILGKLRYSSKGNELVRQLVSDLAADYDNVSRGNKAKIAKSIVQEVRDGGGRFLILQGNEQWEEVSDEVAQAKISRLFRNNRRHRKSTSL